MAERLLPFLAAALLVLVAAILTRR